MANFVLGMDAALYIDSSLVDNVRNLTLNMEAGESDITTRGNDGWRATAPTLRECTAEFQMVWKPGDTAFEAVKDAFLNNTEVELKILSEVGGEGPHGDFSITGFTRNEDLEEAILVDVTAKLSSFTAWIS